MSKRGYKFNCVNGHEGMTLKETHGARPQLIDGLLKNYKKPEDIITVCVPVAIARKELGISACLYQILQVVSVTVFERVPILQALPASK